MRSDDRTYLLDEINLAIVLTKAGSNELVIVEAGTVTETHLLKSWPDGSKVRSKFLRCIRARVGHNRNRAVQEAPMTPAPTTPTVLIAMMNYVTTV